MHRVANFFNKANCDFVYHEIHIRVTDARPNATQPERRMLYINPGHSACTLRPWRHLPAGLWSFRAHCSSCISQGGVWVCGWSWSCIHTSVTGVCGTQNGRSRSVHIPSESTTHPASLNRVSDPTPSYSPLVLESHYVSPSIHSNYTNRCNFLFTTVSIS